MIDIILCKAGMAALALTLAACSSEYSGEVKEDLSARYSFQTQAIDISSAHNARQLGGYVCADGRRVKEDVLLRSGELSWLNEDDAETLSDRYNVKYVVDFRSDAEIEANPDVEIDGARNVHFPVFGEDLYSDETRDKLGYYGSLSDVDEDIALARDGVITERYERILLSERAREAYADFFDVLLDAKEGEAVIWHCSKGKDRAGLASALLLYALGADDDMAARDFEITNEAYAEDIDEARAIAKEQGFDDDTTDEFISASAGVGRKYLNLAVESVEREYGSMRNYLNEELGVSDDEIQELRDKFLED